MDPMQADKVERFKKRINFDAVLKKEKTEEAVSVTWPDMLTAPGLGSGRWMVAADSIWRTCGGVAREWVLRRGEEQVAIVIFVSSEGPGPAQHFLLSRSTENMMIDSPFVKGPSGLGTLAVSMPPAAPPNLIWVFRNVCFDVRSIDAHVEVFEIAKWLQSVAVAGVVASGEARPSAPVKLIISSRKAVVGAPVDILAQYAKQSDETRYMMDLEFDRHAIEVMSQQGLTALIRGRTVGKTTLDLHLIDMATLLSECSRIEFEFLPDNR